MHPRILIIDNDTSVRDALRVVVEFEGMQSELAATSDQALELVRQHKFDVILADMSPWLNGLELLPVFKQLLPSVPVIMISAGFDEKTIARATALGAVACIHKPFRVEDVITPIRAALEKHQL